MENQPQSAGAELHFLDKYAFNFSRDGYRHQVPQHLSAGIVLRVSSFHQRLTQGEPEGGVLLRPPLIPTDEELKTKGSPKGIDCIWVGMIPQSLLVRGNKEINAKDDLFNNKEGTSSNTIQGVEEVGLAKKARRCGNTADLDEATTTLIAFDPNALRVVRKKGYRAPTYYALTSLDPETNLCSGNVIASENVFFFRHFRDDHARSQSARRAACNRKTSLAAGIQDTTAQVTDTTGSRHAHDARTASEEAVVAKFSTALFTQDNSDIGKDGSSQLQLPGQANKKDASNVTGDDDPNISDNVIPTGHPNFQSHGLHAAGGSWDHISYKRGNGFYTSSADGTSSTISNVGSEHISEHLDGEFLSSSPLNARLSEATTDSGSTPSSVGLPSPESLEQSGTHESSVRRVVSSPRKFPIVAGLARDELYPTSCEDGNTEGQSEASARLVEAIIELISKFQQHGNGAILKQAESFLKCLDENHFPEDTRAIGPYLHVQSKIYEKDCRRKLEEIFGLFPELEKEAGLDENRLAWILKGLELTGSSVPFMMIRPYITGFCFEMEKACQSGSNTYKLSRNLLVDITCAARKHAEAFMQQQVSGADTSAKGSKGDEPKGVWTGVDWRV